MFGAALALIPGGTKTVMYALIAFAIGGVIYAGYRHYNNVIEKMVALEVSNANLLMAVNLQNQTIEAQSAAIDEWQEAQNELVQRMEQMAAVAQNASAETRRLREIFAGRDIGELARKRPGLIARRITDGTNRSLRMFECATGATGPDCAN